MAEVTEKSIIVNGVDKCLVSELKRVYGSVEYQGAEYVFLQLRAEGKPDNLALLGIPES